MQLVVKGKNLEVSEAQRAYVESKLGKLDRHLDNITEAEVELSREKTRSANERHVVQVTVLVSGKILRAQEKAADFRSAVDTVADVVQRQIDHFKGKHYSSKGRTSAAKAVGAEAQAAEAEELPAEEAPRIVRVKRFLMKPMSPEEAIDQMELLGHDFFVFLDSTTEQVNVMYRREDGNYGLIAPELG